ncbi:MAG: hypothetical protein VCC00_10100 [Deltaproteobacteria bacterium]
MATINVRNLPDEVHLALRVRAASAGRSMEAEARAILSTACLDPAAPLAATALQEWVAESCTDYGTSTAADDLIAERRREAKRE